MDYRLWLALGPTALLACGDTPTVSEPTVDPMPAAVVTSERAESVPLLPSIQASADKSVMLSPTVAIADAADRLATAVDDRVLRSALQGYLREVEAHWLSGDARLANEAVNSSRQLLKRITAVQKGCVELDAIELALQDAANDLVPR